MTIQDVLDTLKPICEQNPWSHSKNEWVKNLSPVAKGKVGVDLFVSLYGGKPMSNNRSGYDIQFRDMKIESKLSTRSYTGSNCYLYNQIRPADPYTHYWLVAVDLDTVRVFLLHRDDLPEARLWKQHGGVDEANPNTFQLKTSNQEIIPEWLEKFEVTL